ncbi:MAG: class I SAM-dependent methyltransferase [Planctomycetota bacterium]
MATDGQELYSILAAAVSSGMLQKAVFSGPAETAGEIVRIDIRAVVLRGQPALQIASRTATQEFHRNCAPAEALPQIRQSLDGRFRNLLLETPTEHLHAVLNPRSTHWKLHRRPQRMPRLTSTDLPVLNPQIGSSKPPETIPPIPLHDRKPQYIIPPGTPCAFLQATGVMDSSGNVRSSHARKFRQINRFLEFVADLTDSLPTHRPLHVVDFGCGKSYLTFAVQHLLAVIQGRSCHITGLDRREDVVVGCQQVAQRLGLTNLEFKVGDIATFMPDQPPDLVISLHACDTATDDALAQAVRWSAAAILAVPCCHQELQKLLPANPLPPLTGWGIARERFCALATDTHRAALLDAAGYHTQLLEFIDMEHTPKNLLLRAVRIPSPRPERVRHQQQVLEQAVDFRRLLRIPPLKLERILSADQLFPTSAAAGSMITGTVSVAEACQ